MCTPLWFTQTVCCFWGKVPVWENFEQTCQDVAVDAKNSGYSQTAFRSYLIGGCCGLDLECRSKLHQPHYSSLFDVAENMLICRRNVYAGLHAWFVLWFIDIETVVNVYKRALLFKVIMQCGSLCICTWSSQWGLVTTQWPWYSNWKGNLVWFT